MVRTDNTVIAALALKRGDADAMICGLEGRFERHLRNVTLIIGPRAGVKDRDLSTLSMLISQRGVIFLTDTYVSVDPTAEEIAEMTMLAAEEIQPLRHRAQGGAAVASRISARAIRQAR